MGLQGNSTWKGQSNTEHYYLGGADQPDTVQLPLNPVYCKLLVPVLPNVGTQPQGSIMRHMLMGITAAEV